MQIFFSPKDLYSKTSVALYVFRYIITSITYLLAPYPAVSLTVSVSTLFLVTFGYKAKILKKILAAVLAYLTMFASELILAVIIGISNLSPIEKADSGNSFHLVITELIAIIIVTILTHFKNSREDSPIPWTFFFAIILVSVITIYLEIQIFMQKDISDLTYALSLFCVLMLNFIMFYLYDSISSLFKERMKSELAKRETLYYHNQVNIIQKNSNELKQFRHDIKNRIIAVEQLLAQNKNEEAIQYLTSIADKLTSIKAFSETGNLAVDSILNYKLTQAVELGIQVKASILLPEDLQIDKDDLIVILGNLLDNSIEASEKSKKRKYISISIKYDQGAIIIVLKNSYDGNIEESNSKFLTTKSNKKLHGIGLESIKNVIQKNNGDMIVTYNADEFCSKIILIV